MVGINWSSNSPAKLAQAVTVKLDISESAIDIQNQYVVSMVRNVCGSKLQCKTLHNWCGVANLFANKNYEIHISVK